MIATDGDGQTRDMMILLEDICNNDKFVCACNQHTKTVCTIVLINRLRSVVMVHCYRVCFCPPDTVHKWYGWLERIAIHIAVYMHVPMN